MSYLYVKWNRFSGVLSPTFTSLEHVRYFHGHSRNEGLRRRRRRV
jgi:hypothetical protein